MPLMLVEQRAVPLFQAGAVLTVGAVGWTTGSWLQSRPWLRIRRDVLITLGCCSVAQSGWQWWPGRLRTGDFVRLGGGELGPRRPRYGTCDIQ